MKPLLRVDATDARVALRGADGAIWLGPCRAGVALADGRYFEITENARPESGVDGLVVRMPGRGDVPELRWHFQPRPQDQALALWLEVYNATDESLAIARLDVLLAPVVIPLAPFAASPVWLQGDMHKLLAAFASGGTQQGEVIVATGDRTEPPSLDRLVAATHPVGVQLPPGGLLASELLLVVVDQPRETALDLLKQEIARETGSPA